MVEKSMTAGAQHWSQVTGLLRRMDLSYGMGLGLVLLVALLTHMPLPFNDLSTDDYLIRANIAGDELLYEKGLVKADPDKSFARSLSEAFHFYSSEAGTVSAYQDYGNLPWWAAEDPKMTPWRPLSAFTHWLDYQFAPASFQFQALHSLLFFMLYAYCVFRLFWKLSPYTSVAVLATLLQVVDYSHFMNFGWIAARNVFIAGAAGCLMLEAFIEWRQRQQSGALGWSLFFFAVTLLAAESGIALTGYLFAYVLFMEKTTLVNKVKALLPFALLVVLWRLVYNLQGFGASGISLYVDPVHSPLEFLTALVTTLPALLAGAITTLDGALPSLSPELRGGVVLVCAAIALLGAWLIMPLLRSQALVRFMLLGSLLAAVPASALVSGGSRSGLFVSIGFFWILALWLHDRLMMSSIWSKLFAYGVLLLHLVLPAVVSFAVSSTLLPVVYQSDQQYESVSRALLSDDEKSLVVVNSRAPNREFYLPFNWRYEYGVVPESLNVLAPGMASFYLTRNSQREFELRAPVGLPLTAKAEISSLDGDVPSISEVYYLQMLQGLFTEANTQYREGDRRQSGNMTVRVAEVIEGRPSRVVIKFDADVDPDAMAWQWYDWETRRYLAMTNFFVNETRFFAGPLDSERKDLVRWCRDCPEQ